MKGRLELNTEKSLTIPTIIKMIGFMGGRELLSRRRETQNSLQQKGKQELYREMVNHQTWNLLKVAIPERDFLI